MTILNCFICFRSDAPLDAWDLGSLKMILGNDSKNSGFILCQKHKDFCQSRIAELEKELPKEATVVVEQNLPPIQTKEYKDFSEPTRPPNNGELIE